MGGETTEARRHGVSDSPPSFLLETCGCGAGSPGARERAAALEVKESKSVGSKAQEAVRKKPGLRAFDKLRNCIKVRPGGQKGRAWSRGGKVRARGCQYEKEREPAGRRANPP